MNAAIRAVVRTCYHHKKFVSGISFGYQGLIDNEIADLDVRSVNMILGRGGTILKSARCKEFRAKKGRKKAYENLVANDIDALVVIGGNGTLTGAHILYEEYGIPVVGLPGTIDNDLHGTDITIGFDTAVNTVIDAVDKIRDTAFSHNRLFFVEVMGRDSGGIALQSGLAAGAIEILIPETHITIPQLIATIEKGRRAKKTSRVIIIAEGNENGGAATIAEHVTRKYKEYDTRVTVLGHVQRGGKPSALDRVLASELGVAAVEALLAGETDIMVGRWKGQVKKTPIMEALAGQKKLDENLLRISKILSV
jgi:6-phosphofructokinase 1